MKKQSTDKRSGPRWLPIALFALAGILILASVGGYIVRGTDNTRVSLNRMRTSAVLHAASEGLINNIAQQARADKLKELRSDKNFRKRGLDEVNAICDAAMEEARREAEQKFSNPAISDEKALESAIASYGQELEVSDALMSRERAVFSEIYVNLIENVSDWRVIGGEGIEDQAVLTALAAVEPGVLDSANAHLQSGLIRLAWDMASKQQAKADAELRDQLIAMMSGAVADWTEFSGLDDQALWDGLADRIPELRDNEGFRDALIASAKEHITAAENGENLPEPAQADVGEVTVGETQTDFGYFTPTQDLTEALERNDTAYRGLMDQLEQIIPELKDLPSKLQDTLRGNIEKVIGMEGEEFSSVYNTYVSYRADQVLESGAWKLKWASLAKTLLLAGIALLLLGLVLFFWSDLTKRFGVPRTIIALFFVYLCLLAELYSISVRMMLGNVLERMTMYGVLVLAMMPGIQCGIGLNMGMTIGCISGLLGIVLSLQFNMTGYGALFFACFSGALISLPLGWAYSKLLNRMKGSEMTISTYVGFSFVSLMCIGWMLLPFNNPKIIWLLSGRGLRVTHSLLGSFAHLLDNALSFRLFDIKIPTGGLLFLALCCVMVWLFSRSKTGLAMTAVGSNPRFAEASGINVNHMRTVGTVLSTLIAAIGIVIYSQAFGYAQLYTAPRQLGFIASSAILIGGATVSKAKVSHVLIGVFLFEGVLVFGQQIANSVLAGGGLSEVMRIMISNGIILYALTQSGGGRRD